MKQALADQVRRHHAAIREAVMGQWDPIGVAAVPEAADEYDAYVPTIYGLLVDRKSTLEIFEYLWWLETQHMGLGGDRQATEAFAAKLAALGAELIGQD